MDKATIELLARRAGLAKALAEFPEAVAADARGRRPMRDGPLTELPWLSVVEAAQAIAAKDLSPVDLMKSLLERIAALDPRLNAFIRLEAEPAMQAAKAAETEATAGRLRGPLHGVPV